MAATIYAQAINNMCSVITSVHTLKPFLPEIRAMWFVRLMEGETVLQT